MSYTTDDFSESLRRTTLTKADVVRVIAAWGKGDGQGEDAGHYRHSEEGVTDWNGGFLMQLRDGRFAYLTGWCDYTGWGCQDGIELHHFDAQPDLSALTAHSESTIAPPTVADWDVEPADLNKWLTTGDVSE